VERVAVTFNETDDTYPEVVSLRPDFPLVPHLNLRSQEFPRSLCLDDRPWREIRLTLTAPAYIEHIRRWLTLTSRDQLHQPGQLLEPLLAASGYRLVIPPEFFGESNSTAHYLGVSITGGENGRIFLATTDSEDAKLGIQALAFHIRCEPQQHGVIRHAPSSLLGLHDLLNTSGCDLVSTLRTIFKDFDETTPFDHRCIIVVSLPKTRTTDGQAESTDTVAFLSDSSIKDIGCDLGVWEMRDGNRSYLLEVDDSKRGGATNIDAINVTPALTQPAATLLSGFSPGDKIRVAVIGVGALGSQVAMNLVRSGFGIWRLIDDDELLPHNFVRHALSGNYIGCNKAEVLAFEMNSLFSEGQIAKAYTMDLLVSGDKAREMYESIADANVILDLSASVAVARSLAHANYTARRISTFLNPMGTDLVVMAEPRDRSMRLDHLEMYYYRELIINPDLAGHFPSADSTIRYGLSCRDISLQMPQDLVAVHAGIAARAIRNYCDNEIANLCISRCNPDTFNITPVNIAVEPMLSQRQGDWTLSVHPQVLRQIAEIRTVHLPNETGGVLIGSFDTEHRVAYIVHALPSPPDSIEWPNLYIRGCSHLTQEVKRIRDATMMHLDYIGEWHSHPDGGDTIPSSDDLKVFGWLTEHMHIEGRPALMLIAGQSASSRFFIDRIAEEYPEPLCL